MAERAAPAAGTRVAGVIGHPVRHSLSPTIHNAAFDCTGLDWVYVAFDVAPGDGARAVDAMRHLDIGGLSVTMPHKDAVAEAVDRCTPEAAQLGAANTVVWDGDELVGHNTDGDGLVRSILAATGDPVTGRSVVILGAGGAARAAAAAFATAGATEVGICNRTPANAETAAGLAGAAGAVVPAEAASAADVVVNATSVGMIGSGTDGSTPIDPGLLRAGQVVVDLVYHPVETPFLRAAAIAGARVVDGVGMLVHQAARQFELWTGVEAPVDVMASAARAAIEHRASS